MDAGRLRHRIMLQSQQTTRDSDGRLVVSWRDEGEVWAAIEPLSAREFIQAGAAQSAVTARITIRHRADVRASWRATHAGRIYNIQGVLADKDSGLEYLTLPVSEGVNEGE